VRVTMVTGVRHNVQPGDLEAGEGADVILTLYLANSMRSNPILSSHFLKNILFLFLRKWEATFG
jgi:hypothetical protein